MHQRSGISCISICHMFTLCRCHIASALHCNCVDICFALTLHCTSMCFCTCLGMALHGIEAAFALAHALHCAALHWLLHCTLSKVDIRLTAHIIGIGIADACCGVEVLCANGCRSSCTGVCWAVAPRVCMPKGPNTASRYVCLCCHVMSVPHLGQVGLVGEKLGHRKGSREG